MKRFAPILTALLLAAVFMACAEQSAREKLLSRYDYIKPTPAMLKMPQEVQTTIRQYNDGYYYPAAIGFYNILQNPDWRALHESAEYYFAESLYRLRLYQACQYELTKILFKGPDGSAYFTSALIKLLDITYETKDETVIFAVLSNIPLEKFPGMFRNELLYLVGKMYFYQGQYDEAYVKFDQVETASAFYAKANYFKGIVEVRRKEYEKAKETFDLIATLPIVAEEFGESRKVKEMSKLAVGQLFYAAAHDAPGDQQEEIFKAAITFYDQVDRDNPQWFEAQFEKTWSATMIGRYGISLGTSLTLASPYFDDRFVPEVELISAITWYTLCKYAEARETLNRFFVLYGDMHERVKRYLAEDAPGMESQQTYDNLLDQYEAAYKGEETKLPIQVLTYVLNQQRFVNYFQHVQEIDREFDMIWIAPPQFAATEFFAQTVKKMDRQRSNIKKKAGQWALSELKATEEMLAQLLGNAHNIDFELTDAERRRLEEEDKYGVGFQSRIYEQEELLLSPAVPDKYQYWPFDGEFWKDELGYYLMAVEQECQ
ncbi:MAG: hypothetical protein C4523_06585 [Myxococcales bacterium]|nr:MAG: hypothetical protein C4523_06585 [Myxococcales bacterium]